MKGVIMMRTSEAYDLEQFSPQTSSQVRVRVVKTQKTKEQLQKAFTAKCTVYFIVIMLLMSLTVYSRLGLSETKANINNRSETLKELQSENVYLTYQLESKVSLKNAEEYAVNTLGLVKLGSGQIEYVNLQNEDVIEKDESSFSFSEGLGSYLSVVIEFLGG